MITAPTKKIALIKIALIMVITEFPEMVGYFSISGNLLNNTLCSVLTEFIVASDLDAAPTCSRSGVLMNRF